MMWFLMAGISVTISIGTFLFLDWSAGWPNLGRNPLKRRTG